MLTKSAKSVVIFSALLALPVFCLIFFNSTRLHLPLFNAFVPEEENLCNDHSSSIAKCFPKSAFVRRVNANPPFLMVLPPEGTDASVSHFLYKSERYAPRETTIFRLLLEEACGNAQKTGARPPLVVDIGANIGYFTTYALVMGCRVIAFEPQPFCQRYLLASAAINSVGGESQLTLHKAVVSNATGFVTMSVEKTKSGINTGMAKVDKLSATHEKDSVPSVRLDDVIKLEGDDEIDLLKIDVEGHECAVFPTMMNLLKTRKIKVLVAEVKSTCKEWKKKFFHELRGSYHTQFYPEDYDIEPNRPGWPYSSWSDVKNQTFTDWFPDHSEDVVFFRKD